MHAPTSAPAPAPASSTATPPHDVLTRIAFLHRIAKYHLGARGRLGVAVFAATTSSWLETIFGHWGRQIDHAKARLAERLDFVNAARTQTQQQYAEQWERVVRAMAALDGTGGEMHAMLRDVVAAQNTSSSTTLAVAADSSSLSEAQRQFRQIARAGVLLSAFRGATNRPGMLPSWKLHTPLSEWQGVKLDAAVNVTEVELRGQDLTGSVDVSTLPASLQELRLSHNQLTGAVDLSTLPASLQVLMLNRN